MTTVQLLVLCHWNAIGPSDNGEGRFAGFCRLHHLLAGRRMHGIRREATYCARAAAVRDPELASNRAKSDVIDCEGIERIYKAGGQRYGARKVWHCPYFVP
jgi:hypothetical protein